MEQITRVLTKNWTATILGSVLWTQGVQLKSQPLQDSDGNYLLWNGDILFGQLERDEPCDSEVVFERLKSDPLTAVTEVGGPFSLVFWHSESRQLWFGRDVLGRHSLLWSVSSRHLLLTSAAHRQSDLEEVPALGLFMVDLSSSQNIAIQFFPWAHLTISFSTMSNVPVEEKCELVHAEMGNGSSQRSWLGLEPEEEELAVYKSDYTLERLLQEPTVLERVEKLLEVLTLAVECRVRKQPGVCKDCVRELEKSTNDYLSENKICSQFSCQHDKDCKLKCENCSKETFSVEKKSFEENCNHCQLTCKHCSLAVLFSGGLDSTILALLADKFTSKNIPIDLYNVAFQQSKDSFQVPDRVTGSSSLEELKKLAPDRTWNFVQIDISQEELASLRSSRVADLIYPLTSVLDDSLGSALWFAARGQGHLNGQPYISPARVVLSGLGADEQLGGYTRHRNTLRHSGQWAALGLELVADTDCIARRNLGRDDRVVCDHGRQLRIPFLDERVVSYINTLPPWHRCQPTPEGPPGLGDKLLLRLLARRLGLEAAAVLPKRALQFGSRIANRKEKGNQISQRL
ncbi:asparagine synthetase domain-containing protein 1 isoform X2 [Homalodisca vitripennis]|nr:asparagine synthetase domain-containing protein 1 isoform X2 [Homalodisca vitripennis]